MSQSHRPLQEQWKIISFLNHHRDCAKQSFGLLKRDKLQSFFFVLMMALTLTIPSFIGILYQTVLEQDQAFTPASEVTIYLDPKASESQITEVINQLDKENLLENIHFITPNEGLTQLAQSMNIESVISTIDNNPLPGALIGTPSTSVEAYQMELMKHQLEQYSFVESIDLNLSWFKELHSVLQISEAIGLAIIAILGGMMLLSIGCMTYLTAQKSEQDIDVYELIGANKRFIKRPFLYTGFYFGMLAATLNWLILLALSEWASPYWQLLKQHYYLELTLSTPSWILVSVSFVTPIALGILGAQIALYQFFKRRQQLQANI